jgi:hypothetical protein
MEAGAARVLALGGSGILFSSLGFLEKLESPECPKVRQLTRGPPLWYRKCDLGKIPRFFGRKQVDLIRRSVFRGVDCEYCEEIVTGSTRTRGERPVFLAWNRERGVEWGSWFLHRIAGFVSVSFAHSGLTIAILAPLAAPLLVRYSLGTPVAAILFCCCCYYLLFAMAEAAIMAPTTCDVCFVGGGIGGLAAALALHRQGALVLCMLVGSSSISYIFSFFVSKP